MWCRQASLLRRYAGDGWWLERQLIGLKLSEMLWVQGLKGRWSEETTKNRLHEPEACDLWSFPHVGLLASTYLERLIPRRARTILSGRVGERAKRMNCGERFSSRSMHLSQQPFCSLCRCGFQQRGQSFEMRASQRVEAIHWDISGREDKGFCATRLSGKLLFWLL